jgi:Cu(I)/Ag(I) efflux system membrane fusion protein
MNTLLGRCTVIVLLGIVSMACTRDEPRESQAPAVESRKPLYYRNPMDPNRRSPVPAKDEMGMDYIPVYAESAATGEVRISPAVINNLGVRTAPVARSVLLRRTDVVGYVQFDERKVRQVRSRAEGWVEGLAVRTAGETVRAGQPLFTLYSPMLASAQQEYFDALKIGNAELVAASRDRLRSLGLDADARGGWANGRVTFRAPVSGVVTGLEAREGAMLSPETAAVTITELDSLWVIAEIPEGQAGWVKAGVHADVSFPAEPGALLRGNVEYVYPELNPQTRTVRARITLAGGRADMKPNMLARVELFDDQDNPVLNVPRSALIRGGDADRVVVALGAGRFAPRRVVAGQESGDRVAIREGLQEGEQVVVAAQFLLDSEANIGGGLGRLDGGAGAGDMATTATHPGH